MTHSVRFEVISNLMVYLCVAVKNNILMMIVM